MSKKKSFTVVASMCAALAVAGAVYASVAGAQGWQLNPASWASASTVADASSEASDDSSASFVPADNGQVADIVNSAYINVRPLFAADTDTSKSFTYTVSPSSFTGQVLMSVSCPSDSTYVYSNYITVTHDASAKTVTVVLKAVFTKRFQIKLYSSDDATKCALINVDYQSKITGTTCTATVTEGAKITPVVTVQETGGSLSVDKTVSNLTLSYNSDFQSRVEALFGSVSTTGAFDAFITAPSYLTSNFVSLQFLQKVGVSASDASDTRTEPDHLLSDCTAAELATLFDGTKPVFDCGYKVGGKSYTYSFGCVLAAVPIQSITPSTGQITF